MHRVLVANGPNLNLLGTREPEVYGATTLDELDGLCRAWGEDLGLEVSTFQTNHEGALIDALHAARLTVDGVVINAGALTHYSYALTDAITAIGLPVVEVHISDVHAREEWRHRSVIAPACVYTIAGRGVDGYRWALRHLVARATHPAETVAYGDRPDQVADLRLPAGGTGGAAVAFVHGGFWRRPWTRDTIEAVAVDLAGRGLATWNVEYRRRGTGGDADSMVSDVVAAIEALAARSEIDRSRIGLVGHSAGAQLALAAAARLGTGVRVVASLGGVLDLAGALEAGIGDGAAAGYLGERSPEGLDPTGLVPLPFPVVVAHGLADDRVPVTQAERFVAAAQAGGMDVVEVWSDCGHFEWLEPDFEGWDEAARHVASALT